MRALKGIVLLIIANLLVFTTLSISGTILINFVLPLFGIDLRGSLAGMDFAWAMVFGFGGAFISLLMSKTMVKNSMPMQQVVTPATPKERLVYDTVRQIAEREGIRMPEVWVYWDDTPNAFATGPSRNSAMVAVSSGLATNLSDDELRAVLAHEMGHVVNGDMLATTLLQGLMNTFVYFLARVISRPIEERNAFAGFMIYMLLQFVFSILAMIPISWFSRHREFRADAYAARMVGAAPMINALRKIDYLTSRQLRDEPVLTEDALATLKIYNKDAIAHLFATHPPIEARIAALRALPSA
ncbi:MAG: protease HtpX [Zetaproteobacteria bacterium]|nr:MAG: protease HtpX [Zetaproteobacteria bacterium]